MRSIHRTLVAAWAVALAFSACAQGGFVDDTGNGSGTEATGGPATDDSTAGPGGTDGTDGPGATGDTDDPTDPTGPDTGPGDDDDTDTSTDGETTPPDCGNGSPNAGEECDEGLALNGTPCAVPTGLSTCEYCTAGCRRATVRGVGTIEGLVLDHASLDKGGAADAVVTLIPPGAFTDLTPQTTFTDRIGRFRFENVRAGSDWVLRVATAPTQPVLDGPYVVYGSQGTKLGVGSGVTAGFAIHSFRGCVARFDEVAPAPNPLTLADLCPGNGQPFTLALDNGVLGPRAGPGYVVWAVALPAVDFPVALQALPGDGLGVPLTSSSGTPLWLTPLAGVEVGVVDDSGANVGLTAPVAMTFPMRAPKAGTTPRLWRFDPAQVLWLEQDITVTYDQTAGTGSATIDAFGSYGVFEPLFTTGCVSGSFAAGGEAVPLGRLETIDPATGARFANQSNREGKFCIPGVPGALASILRAYRFDATAGTIALAEAPPVNVTANPSASCGADTCTQVGTVNFVAPSLSCVDAAFYRTLPNTDPPEPVFIMDRLSVSLPTGADAGQVAAGYVGETIVTTVDVKGEAGGCFPWVAGADAAPRVSGFGLAPEEECAGRLSAVLDLPATATALASGAACGADGCVQLGDVELTCDEPR